MMNQEIGNEWIEKFQNLIPLESTIILNVVPRNEIDDLAHSMCMYNPGVNTKYGIGYIFIANDIENEVFFASQIAGQYIFCATNELAAGNDEVEENLGALLFFAAKLNPQKTVIHSRYGPEVNTNGEET